MPAAQRALAADIYTAATMRRTLWPFMIWLLALALPMQGIAAATSAHWAAARSDAAHMQAPDPEAAVSHRHAHATAGTAVAQAAHSLAPDHACCDDDAAASLHTCSACAACFVGLGLPSTALALPQPPFAEAAPAAPSAHHAAFVTSGPERPPRPPLG
ncbi:MAG: hypothetical protein F9K36_16950 [Burkholderiaceae bacterium]|nr:MAG: hypothetical protein F9K36_16950 [Burkholderiaceae bacterium]